MNAIVTSALLILWPVVGTAADSGPGEAGPRAANAGEPSWVASHLKLAQSLDDKNKASKPMGVLVSFPKGQPSTWAVDGGLKATDCFGDCGSVQLEWALGIEYHRHTDLKKPLNTLGVGAGLEVETGGVGSGPVAGTVHDLAFMGEFKSDVVASTRSLLTYVDYTPVDFLYSGLIVPSKRMVEGPRWFAATWLPTVGPEDEWAIRAGGKDVGNALRIRGALTIETYPLADPLRMRLQVYGQGELRYTLASSYTPEETGGWSHLIKLGVLYYMDEHQRFAAGAEYLSGENPRTGLSRQEAWTVGLRIQFPGKKEDKPKPKA